MQKDAYLSRLLYTVSQYAFINELLHFRNRGFRR